MGRKLLWALVGILIAVPIVGGIVGTKMLQFQSMAEAGAQFSMPPEPVNVVSVQESLIQRRLSSVGSVMAVQGARISTEADGVVRAIVFEPGSRVKAGDVLVQLDTDVEQAQLHAAEVAADWAQVSYHRAQELSKTRNISQVELDTAANDLKQAAAQVNYFRALMNRKTIKAPFDGELGILAISVGEFLLKGSPVVSLQALDPVFVEFSLPQQALGELKPGLTVEVTTDAYPGQSFTGVISAVDPDLDQDTRNVRVQATLANPNRQLRPGMFVSLELVLARQVTELMIPATAVQYGPHGNAIFVVEGGDGQGKDSALVVRQQMVQLGENRGDFVVVTEGISAGDRVVSTGVFKLRSGMAVVIDNSLAPPFSLTPTPRNT